MKIALLGLAVLMLAGQAPKGALTPEAQALIAPVREAYETVEARQAKLPPPKDARERLERMGELDQVGRVALAPIDFKVLSPEQSQLARAEVWVEIGKRDRANQAALKAMMPKTGWFERSTYGENASEGAFLIVQHAVNDPDLMRDVLARMEPLIAKGEVNGPQWAMLYDRVALEFDKKPQRYGTQVTCEHGTPWRLQDLENPSEVDARRKAVGFTTTIAEYVKRFPGLCPI